MSLSSSSFLLVAIACLICWSSQANSAGVPMVNWKPVPGVGHLPEECIHTVAHNSHITEVQQLVDGVAQTLLQVHPPNEKPYTLPRCAALDELVYSGAFVEPNQDYMYHSWMAWTNTTNFNGISQFLGVFDVPLRPVRTPAILYSFTGLQNNNWIPGQEPYGRSWEPFDIIQPVLQYDESGYAVKSWYVTVDAGAVNSQGLALKEGDQVFGNMTQTGTTSWFIGSTANGQTVSINVNRPRLAVQPWAYTTIECYGCEGCSYVPAGPQHFTQMSMKSGNAPFTFEWEAQHPDANIDVCNTTATISPTTGDVTYTWGLK